MIHVIKEIQVETTHPGRRQWQPTPVFLPREFHGQRSLVGYSPWGRKELDMTEFHFESLNSEKYFVSL